MMKCEESTTAFDKTKLDKLTKLLEKLNGENENFTTAGAKQNARQDDAVDRTFKKEKLDDHIMPASSYRGTHYYNDK